MRIFLFLLVIASAAAPVEGQRPEPAVRFERYVGQPAGTGLTASPLTPLEGRSVSARPGEARRAFALIMGVFGGAAAGAWIGCQIECSGDDGFSGSAALGALFGIPAGVILMLTLDDLTRAADPL